MWSANILEIQKENGRIIVEYVKGEERITESVNMMSASNLKSYVLNKISMFESIDNDMPTVGAIDMTPEPSILVGSI